MLNKKNIIVVSIAVCIIAAIFFSLRKSTQEPPVDIVGEKPDFASFTDVNEKKKAFFDYLRPMIQQENQAIEQERSRLLSVRDAYIADKVTSKQEAYAREIGERYYSTLPSAGVTQAWLDAILLKVNVLPQGLVLTQAANESAWGTSRFALNANNYFGQWCYKAGCGLVPLERSKGETHEVAKFDSVADSISSYFMNVNRNRAYSDLRKIRSGLESGGESLLSNEAAIQLTNGLLSYSERGQDYINDLQAMIRVNKKFWEEKAQDEK